VSVGWPVVLEHGPVRLRPLRLRDAGEWRMTRLMNRDWLEPWEATTPGVTPMPAGSGQMAVPGPIAFQCKDDVPCGTHHCNLQYGKCAFPCQSATDCLQPNTCNLGFCVPLPAPAAH